MEVLHGDIRITLSDQDAIRGMERIRASVKRQMKEIDRQKATVKIEASIRELDKNLIRARRKLKEFEGRRVEGKLDLDSSAVQRELKKLNRDIVKWEGRKASKELELSGTRAALAKLHEVQREQEKIDALNEKIADGERRLFNERQRMLQNYGRMQASAHRMDEQRARNQERNQRTLLKQQQAAIDMDRRRGLEIAKLRSEYDKANQALQRLEQTKRFRRTTSPEAQMEFDIKSGRLIEEMAVVRAKLKAMNADPIDIPVNVKQSRVMEKLLGIGDIGMRLGPFTGTLKQFATAALVLGPILTGLLGSVTALAGALGTGLVGGVGLAATALTGFGLTLGGVFALTSSLMRDFKNLTSLQKAYHLQVLKTGAESEKAKTKLKEFNHALGEVTPTTRAAFLSLSELRQRWRDLRKDARPDFYNALGEAVLTVNTNFGIFSRETLRAFTVVSKGFQSWMKGLRSAEGQTIMFNVMRNTTEAVEELMPALGHLGAAFGRVTQSFSRHFRPVFEGFREWAFGLSVATRDTDKLDNGVDNLVDSFRDVLGVAGAFGRVIIEISRAAMGPGGDLMDNMADGLNDIAASIRNNPRPLREFFGDSINTVKALYGVVQPLLQLFMEFSTILRPATTALLSILGPIAEITAALAGLGPIRAALQTWATLWLFQKGAAMAVGLLAGSVNALAVSMERLGRAQAAQRLSGIAGGLRGGGAVGGAVRPAAGQGRVPVGGWLGGAPRAAAAAPAASQGFGRMIGSVGKGLGALSVGLLGVSAPVAALGAAAVGAAIGIKKLSDRANERAAQDAGTRRVLGKDAIPQSPRATEIGPMGMPIAPTGRERAAWEQYRQAAIKAAEAVEMVNAEIRESGQLQRELVGIGSQLQNSRLMVEQAEKSYADAVKNSGKKSLEARIALQQLRDARTAENESQRQWAAVSEQAGRKVQNAVERAQAEFNKARAAGAPYAEELADRLNDAKNSAAAFDINVRRAKRGLDIFTGPGSEKIGAIMRSLGNMPGIKRTFINVDSQQAAEKLAKVIGDLNRLGQKKAIVRILADADNPKEALRLLNAALDKWEDRHPVAELRADRKQAERELQNANKQLSMYGARKPEAALRARDEAQEKLDRLNRQLDHLDGKKATVTANVKFTLPSNFTTDASGGYGGTGDGWGVPNIAAAVRNYAESNPGAMTNMMMKSGGMLGGMPASGSGLNAFNAIATRFGLGIGSGFRPGSITSSGKLSYHAMGRARDFPGTPSAMMAFAKFMAMTFGARLKELIYTPLGFSIKNGRRVPPYAQADHYDHVHVAMAQGGKTRSEAHSGRYTKPTVLFAEEAGHPEYFISTNPRDKRRSQRLVIEAANELGVARGGLREHGHGFMPFARGGRLDAHVTNRQKRIITNAATKYGIPPYILYGLFGAESNFGKNMGPSSAGARGPFQFMPATARAYGIDPMNFKQAAFAAAKYLGKYESRGVRGMLAAYNAGPAGNPNNPETLAYIPKVLKLGGLLNGGGGGGGGGGGIAKAVEKAVRGASTNLAVQMAAAQGRLDIAGTTEGFGDDIKAIFGYNRTFVPRGSGGANTQSGTGDTRNKRGRAGGPIARINRPVTRHVNGVLNVVRKQDKVGRQRLGVINDALKGKLPPSRRKELLEEKAALTTTLAGNRTKISELREQGAEARFEKRMGAGSAAGIASQTATAEGTESLDDDLAAARAEQNYYAEREKWATKRGKKGKATEARSAYNAATAKIKSITDQIRNNQFQIEEGWNSYAETQAGLTGTLNDDMAAANASLAYWQGRMSEAWGRGDILGYQQAAGNAAQYTERVAGLREDIKRLPLERDRALAALTEDINDDKAAAIALRDYWQQRLNETTASGDIAGQIEAAGNLKSLNDEIKAAEQSVATQMVLLADARRNLYKEFGSNFIATGPSVGTTVPQSGGGDTIVNLTVNGAELGPDPHTWSHNVAWELQAAV